jgi:NAD(P)-dependent dehydrogenase (short-subunit alcohol dehydrogenase family)
MVDVMKTLDGRVAIVTGGANGIGRAIVDALLANGCKVAAIDRDEGGLETLRHAGGADVITIAADATLAASAEQAVAQVMAKWNRLDILVNNIGGRIGGAGLDATKDEWDATLSLCLTSDFLWCRAAAPFFIANGWGRIVNIASNAGRYRSNTGTSGISYSAAKGGVLQFTRSVAHQLGRHGITVNAIAPGSVLTGPGIQERTELGDHLYDRVMTETALGYFAPPQEIASVVIFLASPDASYVTGATVLANGGWCTS